MGVISSTNTSTATFSPFTVAVPVVANITTSATPNTETSYALPTGTKRFTITVEDKYLVRFNYVTGTSTTYVTLHPHSPYEEDLIAAVNLTFFLQSAGSSVRLEIISWT